MFMSNSSHAFIVGMEGMRKERVLRYFLERKGLHYTLPSN